MSGKIFLRRVIYQKYLLKTPWNQVTAESVIVTIGMIEKCMWVQLKTLSNIDIRIIKVASHMKYIFHKRHKTSLSNFAWKVKNKFGIDPILKW